nr:MAG TPA: hypothetical protein [Caudoviricetes sp.]
MIVIERREVSGHGAERSHYQPNRVYAIAL